MGAHEQLNSSDNETPGTNTRTKCGSKKCFLVKVSRAENSQVPSFTITTRVSVNE